MDGRIRWSCRLRAGGFDRWIAMDGRLPLAFSARTGMEPQSAMHFRTEARGLSFPIRQMVGPKIALCHFTHCRVGRQLAGEVGNAAYLDRARPRAPRMAGVYPWRCRECCLTHIEETQKKYCAGFYPWRRRECCLTCPLQPLVSNDELDMFSISSGFLSFELQNKRRTIFCLL